MEFTKSTVWTCALFLAFYASILRASHIEVGSDGGYRKIVVAIPRRVPQSSKLLKNLKDLLSDVSKELYSVTHNRVFFEEIQILVPNTWTEDGNSFPDATFENYVEADIRVDTFNPLKGGRDLYTQQPRGCEEKGDFIFLHSSIIENWKPQVTQFVREWSKFRYGVFDEHGYGNHLYPTKYCNGKTEYDNTGCSSTAESLTSIMDNSSQAGNMYCDATEKHQHNKIAPTPHNNFCKLKDTWTVVKSSPDLRNIVSTGKKLSNEVKFNFVKMPPMEVVFVIDPRLCTRFGPKGSHMLELALRQFESEFPVNGKIGFVIADGSNNLVNLDRREKFTHLQEIKKLVMTANIQDYEISKITAGVETGIEMLHNSHNGHLILISDGPKLNSREFQSVFNRLGKLTFFLLTWTPVTSKLNYDVNDMKEFVNNPTRCLWMDIRVKTSIVDCDIAARIQIEDALALFFAKFGNNDFYPKKVKIHEDLGTSADRINEFTSPLKDAKLVFNTYFCSASGDDKRLLLKINDNDVSVSKDEMISTLSATHKYTLINTEVKIKYEWTMYHPEKHKPISSVWLDIDNDGTKPVVILIGQIEKNSINTNNIPIPWKFYAFSPNKGSVSLEVTKNNNIQFRDELWDKGNGDPDIMSGDSIYSRYFINTSAADERYSFRVIAKNNDAKIISSVGSFYLPPVDRSKLPPNRIADFRFIAGSNIVEWTAPGGYLDHDKAEKYDLQCTANFTSLINENICSHPCSKSRTNTPKSSGVEESFSLEPPTTDSGTYYCVIFSTNKNKIRSERSNVIAICNASNQLQTYSGMIFVALFSLYYTHLV